MRELNKALRIALALALGAAGTLHAESPLDYTGKTPESFYEPKAPTLVVLNYWATYCVPCKGEMKDLSRLYAAYKERGLLVVGASVDEAKSGSLVEKVVRALGVDYPILYGLESVFKERAISGLPTTFFIDADGAMLEEIEGKRSYEAFAAKVESYLAAAAASRAPGAPALDKEARKARYTLVASRLASERSSVEIRLRPSEGYHLNGPGYPALSLEFDPPTEASASGAAGVSKLSAAGVKEGDVAVWKFPLALGVTRLSGKLRAIICGDSLCRPIEEGFALDIR